MNNEIEIEQWDDSAAENWTPPELRTRTSGVSGGASVVAAPPKPVDPRSIPITKPPRVEDKYWEVIQADAALMEQLAPLSAYERGEKIEDRAEILRRIEYQRADMEAWATAQRQEAAEREAAAAAPLAAHPTDAMRIAGLETTVSSLRSDAIETRTRFANRLAALEEAVAKLMPATVSPIRP